MSLESYIWNRPCVWAITFSKKLRSRDFRKVPANEVYAKGENTSTSEKKNIYIKERFQKNAWGHHNSYSPMKTVGLRFMWMAQVLDWWTIRQVCVTFIVLFKDIDLAALRLICSPSTSTVWNWKRRGEVRIDSLEETPWTKCVWGTRKEKECLRMTQAGRLAPMHVNCRRCFPTLRITRGVGRTFLSTSSGPSSKRNLPSWELWAPALHWEGTQKVLGA